MCRQDSALAFAEANRVTLSLAYTSQDDRVTVFEELACFAIRQLDGVLTAPTKFEHGAKTDQKDPVGGRWVAWVLTNMYKGQ